VTNETCGLVLLSGGLDSVAALHWSLATHVHTSAVCFDYGQPARDAEVSAAQKICGRRNVLLSVFVLAEAVRGLASVSAPKSGTEDGVSLANLPARNVILVSCAAAHACRAMPGQVVELVLGCNLEDSARFPDCRWSAIQAMSAVVAQSIGGPLTCKALSVVAPWHAYSKARVLRFCKKTPAALEDAQESTSCYTGSACGECDACRERAAAFMWQGVKDVSNV
jgi:7-cyano-7-deazaguanine synthase